jgi:hypothetical protein
MWEIFFSFFISVKDRSSNGEKMHYLCTDSQQATKNQIKLKKSTLYAAIVLPILSGVAGFGRNTGSMRPNSWTSPKFPLCNS